MHEVALEDIQQKIQHLPPIIFDHHDLIWMLFDAIMVQTTSLSLSFYVTFAHIEFLSFVKAKKQRKVQNANMFLGRWLITLQMVCPSLDSTQTTMWHVYIQLFHFCCSFMFDLLLHELILPSCFSQGTSANMAPKI